MGTFVEMWGRSSKSSCGDVRRCLSNVLGVSRGSSVFGKKFELGVKPIVESSRDAFFLAKRREIGGSNEEQVFFEEISSLV